MTTRPDDDDDFERQAYAIEIAEARAARERTMRAAHEWEYMVRTTAVSTGHTYETVTDEETARIIMDDPVDGIERKLFRRRKAGPWIDPEEHA